MTLKHQDRLLGLGICSVYLGEKRVAIYISMDIKLDTPTIGTTCLRLQVTNNLHQQPACVLNGRGAGPCWQSTLSTTTILYPIPSPLSLPPQHRFVRQTCQIDQIPMSRDRTTDKLQTMPVKNMSRCGDSSNVNNVACCYILWMLTTFSRSSSKMSKTQNPQL
jgi:hypothetical protein